MFITSHEVYVSGLDAPKQGFKANATKRVIKLTPKNWVIKANATNRVSRLTPQKGYQG